MERESVSERQSEVWTFTGLYNVDLGVESQVDLGAGLFLSKPTTFLLSARSKHDLSEWQFQQAEAVSCFLVRRESQPLLRGPERDKSVDQLQGELMAFQILKPLHTLGIIFQGSRMPTDTFSLETSIHRSPMNPGEWARMRAFDAGLISQVPQMIQKVKGIMSGTAAEPKNAINFLQLALEHHHPLITGLLCVMGLEALFDSKNRWDFRKKLCNRLGGETVAFPDWNSPIFQPPSYTVDQIAVHVYTLRSKIAHGVDLRKSASDKNSPVDLLRSVKLIAQLEARPYSILLSEAAVYLLCQVLQKAI